jgi:hypothetical protein
MSLGLIIFVSALVGLFVLLSLLPLLSDGPDTDSLVHLHD